MCMHCVLRAFVCDRWKLLRCCCNTKWAVAFVGDACVYFVAETKSSTVEQDRRQAENLKIACGRKHFELSKDVVFRDVVALGGLVA